MDILILGNGFDIAHGLKTKYCDFLNYCENKYPKTKNVGVDNSNNFLFNNIWVKHFINKNISGDKWIDLEKEIYNVIVELSKLPYFKNDISPEKYNNISFIVPKDYMGFNFDDAKKYFKESSTFITRESFYVPIKDFIGFLYEQLRDFVKEFEKYLTEETQSIKSTPEHNLRINSKCVSLLNFNYTDTCEKLYKINFNYNNCGIRTKAVYVHGKINSSDCNLVLGTHSFDNDQISVEFNIFKKHHQRHKYGTIELYQDLLNELKYPKKIYTPVFHIIGHSLDKTDHNILKHILLARERSVINVYYHNEEALARMQNNIDLIIGEEEVMSKVKFIKQDATDYGILM